MEGSSHHGPAVGDVLYLQESHRSSVIWSGAMQDNVLHCRRHDKGFWTSQRLDPRVEVLIDRAGFGGVYKTGRIRYDHAFITALVERWRQETHTFHLPVGEATVTLQDIEVLWGLRVDGPPITGEEEGHSPEMWQGLCKQTLGFTPPLSSICGGRLRCSALVAALQEVLPENAPDERVVQYTRIRLMVLLGGLLFADKSGSMVPLHYMQLLQDLDKCGLYSWGSAVLACLYRNLCLASHKDTIEISGPLVLLQLWAWERFPTLRPTRLHPLRPQIAGAPYGARWAVKFEMKKTATHVLRTYRDQLDGLRPHEFIWCPYTHEVMQILPASCFAGAGIWRSRTSLICWETIELYYPDRVMRQFGMEQLVPEAIRTDVDLHRIDRRGHYRQNWSTYHAKHVQAWDQRYNTIIVTRPMQDVTSASDNYITWYREHTRLLISNPASQIMSKEGYQGGAAPLEILVDAIHRINYDIEDASRDKNRSLQSTFSSIQDKCKAALSSIGRDDILRCRPSHQTGFTQIANDQCVANIGEMSRRKRRHCVNSIGGQEEHISASTAVQKSESSSSNEFGSSEPQSS